MNLSTGDYRTQIMQEEILRLENVISTYRKMLIALNMAPTILDKIEDEAYNKEI